MMPDASTEPDWYVLAGRRRTLGKDSDTCKCGGDVMWDQSEDSNPDAISSRIPLKGGMSSVMVLHCTGCDML